MKKQICTLLITVLVVGVCTGCGKEKKVQTSKKENEISSEKKDTADENTVTDKESKTDKTDIKQGENNKDNTDNKEKSNNHTQHKHSYSASVKQPTCTEQGYTTYTCSCGETYNDNYVSAEYSDAKVHLFRKFRAPFSGKAEHTFPEESAVND